jgi:hypothetical protein
VRVCSLVGALGVLARRLHWHDWLPSGAALPSLVMSQGSPLEGSSPIGDTLTLLTSDLRLPASTRSHPQIHFPSPTFFRYQVPAEGKGTLHVEVANAIRNHDETAPPSSCTPGAGSAPVYLRRPSFLPTTSPPCAPYRSLGMACITPPCVTSEC